MVGGRQWHGLAVRMLAGRGDRVGGELRGAQGGREQRHRSVSGEP